ncbi:MAG: hypothetical protein BroJett011_18130 [Chloroflexota bacterium]|nr:MAG: hypothetical protein BroJett011_18130 [Chloroflexota bacterium]
MAKPLPWFALEKVQYGAFAALLGLSLTTNGTESFTGHWTAFAAGDSCLFHVRHPELLVCFPIERADQFNNHPVLLSTNPLKNQLLSEVADKLEWRGQWQVGDQFLLMTDALAQWFMVQVEQGEQPWLTLKEVASHSQLLSGAFNTWITDLRTSKNIRNDDVTLLMIDITGA